MSPEKQATDIVLGWIAETHGEQIAGEWAINCTPMPCGFPDARMLDEGIALACREVTIWELIARAEQEMAEQMAALKEGTDR